MPVNLKRRKRGNRGIGFDREICQIATAIVMAQTMGQTAPKEVAAHLNAGGHRRDNGCRISEAAMRRMLRRGVELGFHFKLQSRQEAGARPRRARHQLQIEMGKRRRAAEERQADAALSEVAMIAAKEHI